MANKDYWGRISKENDKSFEETLDQLYFEHHYHPTNIPTFNVSKADQARTAENDAQAAQLAKQGKGKAWVNGLPGPASSEPLTGGIGGGQVDWRVALLAAVVFMVIMLLICRASGGIQ